MKALTIPASRVSISGCMRSISATVSNLRTRIDVRSSIMTASVATVALFACLGAMYVPGIIVSGLSALMAVALAPIDEKGGEA